VGNSASFADALDDAMKKPLQQEANACIAFYKSKLSFDAIAAIAAGHYKKIISNRNRV
jgi:hypothetical protein